MRRSTVVSLSLSCALSATAFAVLPSGEAGATLPDDVTSLAQTFDIRDVVGRLLTPTSAQVAALQAVATPGVRVRWDRSLGTPRSITKPGDTLTGPQSGAAVDIARNWIAAHREAFALAASDVSALRVGRDHTLPGIGAHVVTFGQTVAGVPVVEGGRLNVVVDSAGRVIAYNGNPGRTGALAGTFALTAAQALTKVASAIAPDVDFAPQLTGSELGYSVFAAGPFAAVQRVMPAAFAMGTELRPAYRVLFVKAMDEAYDTVVDAQTGSILYRESLVDNDSEGTVYQQFPGAPKGGSPEMVSFGPTAQSPSGFLDPTGVAGLPGPTTFGNNADTFANWSNFEAPADRLNRPVSPTSQFNYPYANNWAATNGATVPPSYALDRDAAATNLFYTHNRIHDEYYRLGFTESAGNFQVNNNNLGGNGGDPIAGLVHAGAASGGAPTYTGRDNAYMLTLPDGIQSWSGMFLWEPINDAFEGPYRDGNFDASVIQHEYTHGLSNRYVAGGGETLGPLGAHQSGSMGEGWSDWYALNHLYSAGLLSKAVVGEYVTGNPSRGIRNWNYDQNPTNYGNVGYDLGGAEVHSDGEIWTTTLWDLRKALVAKYGAADGADRAARLITDAMPLTPVDPSFLDARDGILMADQLRYHGENTDIIWTTFARRGAGFSASTIDGNDTDPKPGFDHAAPTRNNTLSGHAINSSTGTAVSNARVFIGEYEVRSTPVAKTGTSGAFALSMVNGTYTVTVQAPGFGIQTFRNVAVTSGKTTALKLTIAPNLASMAAGARVVSTTSEKSGLPAKFLLDDTEASVWSTQPTVVAGAETPYNAGPKQSVTVQLARQAKITTIQVSAYKNTTDGRFNAAKDITVQTSTDGVLWKTVKTATFATQIPRPVAPDLHVKQLTLASPTDAKFVRLYLDSIQGESLTFAEAAELEVFASKVAGVEPDTVLPAESYTETGTISVNNPSTDPTVIETAGVFYTITGGEFSQTCAFPPASQGVDGWVTKLPAGYGDGTHSVTGTSSADDAAGHDLDLYFFDSDCRYLGDHATSAADESASIPGGAAFVLTHLYVGANVAITVKAVRAG